MQKLIFVPIAVPTAPFVATSLPRTVNTEVDKKAATVATRLCRSTAVWAASMNWQATLSPINGSNKTFGPISE